MVFCVRRFWSFAATVLVVALFPPLTVAQGRQVYWDEPREITAVDSRFPVVVTDGAVSYCLFEEVKAERGGGQLWIAMQMLSGTDWSAPRRVAGPFSYSGEVPDCFSAALCGSTLVVAVAVDGASVRVYSSDDGGATFFEAVLLEREQAVVGPRLFVSRSGQFVLFASRGSREVASNTAQEHYERFSFSLVSAQSRDGRTWSALSPFAPSRRLSNPFSPFLCATDGGDIVVFQAQRGNVSDARFSNQLYASLSDDDLQEWSEPVLVTDARSLPSEPDYGFERYHNQRPFVFSAGGTLHLAWERTLYTSDSADIWVAELSPDGAVAGAVEQVTMQGGAHRPILFLSSGALSLLWFDSHRGNDSVYMAQKGGLFWDERTLCAAAADSWARFAYPAVASGELSFVWQALDARRKEPRLYALQNDRRALPPRIVGVSFTEGRRSAARKATARLIAPPDPSGIAGFSWLWTQDKDAVPEPVLTNLADSMEISGVAPTDGVWYFKARALDYAGNWSATATLAYHRDLTPPLPPVVTVPARDGAGFLRSNTFEVRWRADARDDDVVGYTYTLSFLAPMEKQLAQTTLHPLSLSLQEARAAAARLLSAHDAVREAEIPPRRSMGAVTVAAYDNRPNGLYAFSVCAVDAVGNIGARAVIPLLLNKYEPTTVVTALHATVDEFGTVDVSVLGRGFTYDGTISAVYLDRDGKAPYDIVRTLAAGDYKVADDGLITALRLEDADAGVYRVGLLHTDRGLYFSNQTLAVDSYGTVKLARQYDYRPVWRPQAVPVARWQVDAQQLLLGALGALSALCVLAAARGLSQAASEVAIVRQEVRALLTGGVMPLETKRARVAMLRRGASLKTKLALFTTLLVLGVVLLVALPLGFVMMTSQERALAHSLEEKVQLLLNSIASSARTHLPAQNDLELGALPNLAASMPEIEHVTILAQSRDGSDVGIDYVWATNDDDILSKLDTDSYIQGSSRYVDATLNGLFGQFTALDEEARQAVGAMTAQIRELSAEGAALALETDDASIGRLAAINAEVRLLSERSTEELEALSRAASGSFPPFDAQALDHARGSYLFYKPVLYRQGGEATYVRALVLMRVSVAALVKTVAAARRTLVYVTAIIAFVAITIGMVGSLLLATIIVRPIRGLVAHVEMISRTRHKEQLAGQQIVVKSHDEIGLLGETVNEMTRSLVKAALDETLLMDGKAVQQAFIPLLTDDHGNKATTAGFRDGTVQLFGYYEGASGVSGDYFDYKKLDERWYCLIKCDASGHGVPAALIMTVVATLFRQYFEGWSWRINGTNLNTLVTQINDFIESLGLRGKFATLMVCLLDTRTGDVYMCNAGDNVIHYYDMSDRVERTVSLTETPAAGPLPSFMVDMKGGFTVERLRLDSGDVLFLYTDGIEESTRRFRDSAFAVTKCTAAPDGGAHENHKAGDDSEQLGPERIRAVIEAVFARGRYTLTKHHNPLFDETLVFDFGGCTGSVEDAVLALASVEKVFRLYKDPQCTDSDLVRVDRNIDRFLRAHFSRYDFYCSRQSDTGEANYLYYTHLREDEQLDDLTLLAVQKS